MAKKPPRKKSTAQKLKNPNWRAGLPDKALSKSQLAQRKRARALKADPLAKTKTLGDLEDQAGILANAQMRPIGDELTNEESRLNALYGTRTSLANQLGAFQQTGVDKAAADTTTALNSLIANNAAVGAGDQANLQGALRNIGQSQQDLVGQLGGNAQAQENLPSQEEQLVASAAANRTSQNTALNEAAQANIGAAQARRAMPGQGLSQLLAGITAEHQTGMNELGAKRKQFGVQKKDAVKEMIQALQEFEINKRTYGDQRANMIFQQRLAEKEFGLKKSDLGFQQDLATETLGETKRSNRAQEGITRTGQRNQSAIDWANVGLRQQEIQAMLAQARREAEGSGDEKKKQRAAVLAKGIEAMSAYMAPGKNEGAPNRGGKGTIPRGPRPTNNPDTPENEASSTRQYVRTYDEALGVLRENGMSRSDALRVLSRSRYGKWRDKASRDLDRLKRRGASGYDKGGRPG
jgi:hypothetical protein